jgi:hypothetical protein
VEIEFSISSANEEGEAEEDGNQTETEATARAGPQVVTTRSNRSHFPPILLSLLTVCVQSQLIRSMQPSDLMAHYEDYSSTIIDVTEAREHQTMTTMSMCQATEDSYAGEEGQNSPGTGFPRHQVSKGRP